jgi:hypothetical protein
MPVKKMHRRMMRIPYLWGDRLPACLWGSWAGWQPAPSGGISMSVFEEGKLVSKMARQSKGKTHLADFPLFVYAAQVVIFN